MGEVVGQKRDLGEVTLGILRWVTSWSKTRENREEWLGGTSGRK